MDVLLIDPPYSSLKGMPTDRGYNIGLTSLAAYLRRDGFDTAVVAGDLVMDLPSTNKWLSMNVKKYAAGQRAYEAIVNDNTHMVWRKMTDIVSQAKPMAVGIAYLSPLKCVVEKIAGLVKEIDPDIKVIVGSFHPTFCPEEVMQNPDIDFAVRGEGEIPLLHIIKELKKDHPGWETVPGIHYRDRDGQVKNNPCAPPIDNLDELPFPARELVLNCDYSRYSGHSISTVRGCPYACSFCADKRLWGGKVRRRSVDNVIEELKLLKNNYKVRLVEFVDGTFTFDREYLRKFCNALIEQNLNLEWGCTARYDNLDEQSLKLMKKANCAGVYLGLESGSDRVLEAIDKGTTVEKIVKVSEMVHDCGIPSVTSVLLGLPGEDKEDIEKTLKLMRKIKTDLFDVNTFVPIPGTRSYDELNEDDRRNIDWKKVGFKSFESYFSSTIPLDDFNGYRLEAFQIANNLRIKTIIRFGARMFFHSCVNMFKRS